MKCKICGKESENEYCDDCFTKAMAKLEKKTKKSSKWNKIVMIYGFLAIVFCGTILVTSGSTIPLFDSDTIPEEVIPEETIPKSETIITDDSKNYKKPVVEPEPEKPVIEPEPEYEPDEDVYTPMYDITLVVEDYYDGFVYRGNNDQCLDMACDIWSILKSKGYKSQIVVGNLEYNKNNNKDYGIEDTESAWITVYLDNEEIIIDCERGFITTSDEYYTGFFFDSPLEITQYKRLYDDYVEKRDYYNNLKTEVDYAYDIYKNPEDHPFEATGNMEYDMQIMDQMYKSDEEMKELFDRLEDAEEESDEAYEKFKEANDNLIPYDNNKR